MKLGNIKKWKITVFAMSTIAALIILACLGNLLFDKIRFDTTSDRRFSLSEETERFLQKNQKYIAVRLYKDKNLADKNQQLGNYAEYVRKILEKYESESNSKISLTVIETQPFTNTQLEAQKAGMEEFVFANGERYGYLGMVFTNESGSQKIMGRLVPDDAENLEEKITNALSILAAEKMPVVGVISPIFRVADPKHPLIRADNYPFITEMEKHGYQVVALDDESADVPQNVDVLLVFYPFNLSVLGAYAIDQYLLRGGNVIIMLDAFSEMRFANQETYEKYDSGLDKLLRQNGVVYHDDVVVGNGENAQTMMLDGRKIKYPLKPIINGEDGDETSINKGLGKIYLSHSGFFEYAPNQNINTKVLLKITGKSGEMPIADVGKMGIDTLSTKYRLTQREYPVAILLEGDFRSAFGGPLSYDPDILKTMPPFLSVSVKNGKLLLLADADMMMSDLWQKKEQDSDNMRFLFRALDYMSNSGYVTLVANNKKYQHADIRDVVYQKAENKYLADKMITATNLLKIRQQKTLKKEDTLDNKLTMIKDIKDLEELQRQEAEEERRLEKINYTVEQQYLFYRSVLLWMMIVFVPLIMALAMAIIYYIYERKSRQKIAELIK